MMSLILLWCPRCREEQPCTNPQKPRCPECGAKLDTETDEPRHATKHHERDRR